MKRTPLKRRSRLKRTTRLRPRSRTKKYARRTRDAAYMAWIRKQPCCAPREGVSFVAFSGTLPAHVCEGRMEAHHAGRRAAGQKADDSTCIPLCSAAHRAWHRGAQPFLWWGREERRRWADEQISRHRTAYATLTRSAA